MMRVCANVEGDSDAHQEIKLVLEVVQVHKRVLLQHMSADCFVALPHHVRCQVAEVRANVLEALALRRPREILSRVSLHY